MADWGNLQVQFSGSAASSASGLRDEIQKGGHQQIFLLSTMSELRERSLLQDRLLAAVAKIYVVLVLVLAALGLLGLLLFLVSSREKEIAIRIALGAERTSIRSLIAREAALSTGTGILIGLPASYFVVHSLSSVIFGVSPMLLGPASSALAVFGIVVFLAILVPMYRAGSISPNAVLRDN